MGRIQSSVGLISGIDIDGTVEKLSAIAAQPRDRLITRTQGLQKQQVAYTELTALVIGVQIATDAFTKPTTFASTSVRSSKSDIISVSSNGTPAAGKHRVTSVRLSQTQQLTSSSVTGSDQVLGAGSVTIRTGGFVDASAILDQLNGGAGVERGKISITDRSGASADIDLRFAQTVSDVLTAINESEDIRVSASVSGDRIVLTDLTGSTASNLKVTEVGSGNTALGLGLLGIDAASNTAQGTDIQKVTSTTKLSQLLDGRGIVLQEGNDLSITLKNGTQLNVNLTLDPKTATVGDLLTAINNVGGSNLTASIASDGDRIQLVDNTGGGGSLTIADVGTGRLASDLGIEKSASGTTISGGRLKSGLDSPLLSSLNGGQGLGTLGQINLTDRSGATATINLSAAETLNDVLKAINDAPVGLSAVLNSSRTGILVRDTTGSSSSSLIIANGDSTNSADKLNIDVNGTVSQIDSGALKLQSVNENTTLASLNQGKGVQLGSFSITDASGLKLGFSFGTTKPSTVGDVIKAINDTSLAVEARINEAGDGIVLVDTTGNGGKIKVAEVGSGTTATDLGIFGESTSQTVNGSTVQAINGSKNVTISLTSTDTVRTLLDKLNAAGSPVTSSLLSIGGGAGGRVVVNSATSGTAGRFQIESTISGLSFSETSQAQDALIAIGATSSSSGTLVSSSTDTFNETIEGLSFTVKDVSLTSVELSVTQDNGGIERSLDLLVTQYNKIVDKLATLTAFDPAKSTQGVLFGSTETLRIQTGFARLFSARQTGAGTIKSVAELGISFTDTGKIELDKEKLRDRIESDPNAVKEFLSKEKTGFAARSKTLIDSLAGVNNSALISKNQSLQQQIDQNTTRTATLTAKLDRDKNRLLKQFYSMEAAIQKIQSNFGKAKNIAALTSTSS